MMARPPAHYGHQHTHTLMAHREQFWFSILAKFGCSNPKLDSFKFAISGLSIKVKAQPRVYVVSWLQLSIKQYTVFEMSCVLLYTFPHMSDIYMLSVGLNKVL